jgi:hypothetical protein
VIFTPRIEGAASIRASASDFFRSFGRRVDAGLLSGRPHPRSNYTVTSAEGDRLKVSAADWRTAFNVGLNEIELRALDPGRAGYRVEYKRWAVYVLALGATIGAGLIGALAFFDLHVHTEAGPALMIPGLSDNPQFVEWVMIAFWGFVWPWLLIAFHKRPLRRLFERIIAEVDAGAGAPSLATDRSR